MNTSITHLDIQFDTDILYARRSGGHATMSDVSNDAADHDDESRHVAADDDGILLLLSNHSAGRQLSMRPVCRQRHAAVPAIL